jgi:hypothetical protein
MDPEGHNRQLLKTPKIVEYFSSPGSIVWSRDSRHAYFSITEKDGTSSVWQLPINGDPERRLIHYTDPMRQFYRPVLDVDSTNFYLVFGERQSDIWTMELKKQ